jgi:putative ATPase
MGRAEGLGLFEGGALPAEPLASRMRPRSLDEFVGQSHIVGPGRLLRRAIQADRLSSLIFWGPPGTGKTSLARIIAASTKSRFVSLNAVLSGVKELREAIEAAEEARGLRGSRTILFVDEVHRWNKSQQDALLPSVENGTVILIGATTENPFFEVNKALVSRSRVFQLKALDEGDMRRLARMALDDRERGYGRWKVRFEEGGLEHLVESARGDARSLLNAIELAVETSPRPDGAPGWPPPEGAEIFIGKAACEDSIQRAAVLYDKDGDCHYDAISAFIKSLRGSDPDASLYWLARMLAAGEDPSFIIRRMLISASEDVGLADPEALGRVVACAEAFDRVGLPEGRFHLAQAALVLALSRKSNSTLAFFDALAAVEAEAAEVPDRLKDANRDAEGMGHGAGYLYPHAYTDHWVAQGYLPKALVGKAFYEPGSLGWEGERAAELRARREAVIAATRAEAADEAFSYNPGARKADAWLKRAESGAGEGLASLRKAAFDLLGLKRDSRVLVARAEESFFIWEALRRAPQGLVAGLCVDSAAKAELERHAEGLPEIDRPLFFVAGGEESASWITAALERAGGGYDALIARGALFDPAWEAALRDAIRALDGGARCLFAERLPCEGMRLSFILSGRLGEAEARDLRAVEEAFYAPGSGAGPGMEQVMGVLKALGLECLDAPLVEWAERERIGPQDARRWTDPGASRFGKALAERAPSLRESVAQALEACGAQGPVEWARRWRLILCAKASA